MLDGDYRKGLACIDPKTGQTKWSVPISSAGVLRASPTGADGKIYVMNESAEVFERMGAVVTKRLYPGMGHLINDDEIAFAQAVLDAAAAPQTRT